ncbi:MAG: hypothetical protein IKK73_07585, partial [Akkermansia sp.]|nr:hypothetical protein [Akkermansia sp.]
HIPTPAATINTSTDTDDFLVSMHPEITQFTAVFYPVLRNLQVALHPVFKYSYHFVSFGIVDAYIMKLSLICTPLHSPGRVLSPTASFEGRESSFKLAERRGV